MSRLLKYVLSVFLDNFLQKLRYVVYAFPSEKFFDVKNLFLSLDPFIMALYSCFVKYGASFAWIYFLLIAPIFIKNTEDCILDTFQIRSPKIKFGDIRPKVFFVKVFIVLIFYYFRWRLSECRKVRFPKHNYWKQFGWVITIRSIHTWLSGFFKCVGFLIELVSPFKLQNFSLHFSFALALKSPRNKKFW